MSSLVAQDIIDRARIRHWTFSDIQVGDGAALLYLNDKQRQFILDYGTAIEGLVGTSAQIATQINGSLVGTDATGHPIYLTTFQDGWVVHKDASGHPYVDFTELPVAGDPFGQNGGTPGFPLPTDFVKLITSTIVLTDNSVREVKVIMERDRAQYLSLPGFRAFISGNRLVPVRSYSTAQLNSGDLWSTVTQMNLSYVGLPSLTTLTDPVMAPAVLVGALIAALAKFFAMQSPKMLKAEKDSFMANATAAEEALSSGSFDMMNEMVMSTVKYRG